MRKLALFLAALATLIGLSASATATADTPYKFGPHEVNCQATPDQPLCVGSH